MLGGVLGGWSRGCDADMVWDGMRLMGCRRHVWDLGCYVGMWYVGCEGSG